jgi:hypothetical protein
MSRPEADLNKKIMSALAGLHPIRVENLACPGTPDINAAGDIWIESKVIKDWPDYGVVRVPHFTPQQRLWHIHRQRCGGNSLLCLQVSRKIFLFRGCDAAQHLGKTWVQKDVQRNSMNYADTFGHLDTRFAASVKFSASIR